MFNKLTSRNVKNTDTGKFNKNGNIDYLIDSLHLL